MFAAVFIPDFALQAVLRLDPGLRAKAVALVDPALSRPEIVQLTNPARARGVMEGLTASQAMARCADLQIKARSLEQEKAATDVLLQTAYAFSPNIEATAAGVCTMELKGLGLNGDDAIRNRAGQMLDALAALGMAAQIGVAVTPALSLLAARVARPVRIVRDSDAFVSAMPVAALEPPGEMAEVLQRWGIRTVGALLQLGKAELSERLGAGVLPLLNRVSMRTSRPLKLITPKETFEEQTEFETEIETAEPLLFVLRRFVEQLVRRLDVIHLVVAQLDLQLKLGSGAVYEHQFRIPAPTGNIDTLFRTLQTHLDSLRTDAPIVALRLEAKPCKPQTHQFGLFETTLKDPNQFAETLARLTALCGAERVGTPVPEPSHKPDAFRMKAPEFDGTFASQSDSGEGAASSVQTGLALRRFRPPVPALVELRERRPSLIRSSVVSGAVIDCRGPYFSSGDWWDRNVWEREEWDVQAGNGTLYRIYRSGGEFFVEGKYD